MSDGWALILSSFSTAWVHESRNLPDAVEDLKGLALVLRPVLTVGTGAHPSFRKRDRKKPDSNENTQTQAVFTVYIRFMSQTNSN